MGAPEAADGSTRVAIVGTGLAGLTTAHLLQGDARKRFRVTVFEQGQTLSFDSHSVAVKNRRTGAVERVDLPMRASAGGYYANLMRLYRHVGITVHPVRFLFVFAQAFGGSSSAQLPADRLEDRPDSYFVHTSNLHSIPPPRPISRGFSLHLWEVLFLIVCYAWFSIACFTVSPRRRDGQHVDGAGDDAEQETVAEYLRRIRIPERYVTHYLLPLMSSVSTCTHAELLAFPASDIVTYKQLSHRQQHYTVCGGVNTAQSKLAEGLDDIRLGASVVRVQPNGEKGVTVRWKTQAADEPAEIAEEVFDRVVLAVSPDVAATIFESLEKPLAQIPTTRVSSSVVAPLPLLSEKGSEHVVSTGDGEADSACMHHSQGASPAQRIMLRTRFRGEDTKTEALHVMPGGVTVSTCPLNGDVFAGETLKTARFTRTLRSTKSQATVKRLMRHRESEEVEGGDGQWANGDDGVWLTGAWCWDGMVLLEGCVVSAMRVARDFGVDIPWEKKH